MVITSKLITAPVIVRQRRRLVEFLLHTENVIHLVLLELLLLVGLLGRAGHRVVVKVARNQKNGRRARRTCSRRSAVAASDQSHRAARPPREGGRAVATRRAPGRRPLHCQGDACAQFCVLSLSRKHFARLFKCDKSKTLALSLLWQKSCEWECFLSKNLFISDVVKSLYEK